MFSIDIRSREPIYEQLVKNVIDLITKGVMMPDDPLPSVRALARDLGINPNTVQKAYRELELKGMIYQAAGRGSFVAQSRTIADAMLSQRTAAVKEAVSAAHKAGVLEQDILKIVTEIYGEGDK